MQCIGWSADDAYHGWAYHGLLITACLSRLACHGLLILPAAHITALLWQRPLTSNAGRATCPPRIASRGRGPKAGSGEYLQGAVGMRCRLECGAGCSRCQVQSVQGTAGAGVHLYLPLPNAG